MSWRVGICCHGFPDPGSLSPSSVDTNGMLTQPEAQKQRKRPHPRVGPFPDSGILCLLWPSGSGDLIRVDSTLPAVSSLWAPKPHSQLFYILPLCGPLPSDNLTLGDYPNLHNERKHLCSYTRDRRDHTGNNIQGQETTLEFIYRGQGGPQWNSYTRDRGHHTGIHIPGTGGGPHWNSYTRDSGDHTGNHSWKSPCSISDFLRNALLSVIVSPCLLLARLLTSQLSWPCSVPAPAPNSLNVWLWAIQPLLFTSLHVIPGHGKKSFFFQKMPERWRQILPIGFFFFGLHYLI